MVIEFLYGSDLVRLLGFLTWVLIMPACLTAVFVLESARRTPSAPVCRPIAIVAAIALLTVAPGASSMVIEKQSGVTGTAYFSDTAADVLSSSGYQVYDATEVNRWVEDAIEAADLIAKRDVEVDIDSQIVSAVLVVEVDVNSDGRGGVATLRLDESPATS